ncbi:uncharacterized protein LOC123524870 [Mercenaria mercenaria]|uniref:uncharacterized protein LOC123524870 n=1 Tax=Mercenaria mercenaria TaxID=6596 RepID=UPI00234F176E|nr:uncharacterized protein LOC123524870 [Mercenaria mercenaria]
MSHREKRLKWSMVKYDLKTGLDILKMPCLVKVAYDALGTTFEESQANGAITDASNSCRIKLEKQLSVWFVRARVLDLTDVDWFTKKKGKEFVRSHGRMAGSEILIPLEYGGKMRLNERMGGTRYFSIREIIQEFPRFVRVDKDTICASPGVQAAQIVEKGTILELDRVTKSIQTIRGSRETYLICKDSANSRELAFRQMAPVQFTKVPDMTKDCLKDFVEHLPLPQVVEFLNINPYDVISVDDDDARDLLVIMSGPVELLGLQMEHFIVGKVDEGDANICDIIAVPLKDNVLESFLVHIPVEEQTDKHTSVTSAGEYVDLALSDEQLYDCLQQKLYLRYTDDETPLILRSNNSEVFSYEVENLPDTPPIPEKLDECPLKHTLSAQHVSGDHKHVKDRPINRKRFFSANDIERKNISQRSEREQNGLKTYLSHLSRRMKSTASQILFGIEAFSGAVDQDLEYGGRQMPSCRKDRNSSDEKRMGFICYLDTELTDDTIVPSSKYLVTLNESRKSDNVIKDDIVYASVDVLKKNKSAIKVTHLCPVCRDLKLQ